MSSPIELPVRPAPGIGALQALPWVLLALALGLAAHPLTLVAALLPLGAGVAAFWRHGVKPGGHSITEICQSPEGLTLHTHNGQCLSAALHPVSRVGAGWLWLRLDTSVRQYSLVLSDRPGFRNTEAGALRRFRTRLRLTHTGQQQ